MVVNGGFASVRLAQIILESNWASSTPKDLDTGAESFNLTGVKGVGPAGSVRCWTWEHVDGKDVKVVDSFRAYHSFPEHIIERDRIFLDWRENYGAYLDAKSPEEAIHALTHARYPYATDPTYESKLLDIIASYDLKRFDSWPFADVDAHAWYAEDVAAMKSYGFVKGDENGNLGLSDEGIRLLVILRRMYESLRK